MQGDRELCLAGGMDDYLTKPFTLSQLEEVLARWVPKKRLSQVDGADVLPSAPLRRNGKQAQEISQKADVQKDRNIEPQIIDQAALAAIRSLQRPGQPDIVARVLTQYVDTSPELVNRIRRAVLSKDGLELRAAAHRLKSSSAQVGATALAFDCRELEMMGVSQEFERADETLQLLERHYADACAAFQDTVGRGKAA
jgi:HPt (histidine-containing phosphotransfer) domain-containing protein